MDPAVELVQAYLNTNGYFTVAEYPVLEAYRRGPTRTTTDLDILAVRFPFAGANHHKHRGRHAVDGPCAVAPDPALHAPADCPDMILGEVKEGTARFNPAARDPLVLGATLARFGCCAPEHADETAEALLRHGQARTHGGHQVRMVAFGSIERPGPHLVVTTGHMIDFLRAHVERHWDALRHAHLSNPTLALLALMEKAARSR